MNEIDLLVECNECGADPHHRCAEDDGIGGWSEVASHHDRIVTALTEQLSRLAAENETLRKERDALFEVVGAVSDRARNGEDAMFGKWRAAKDERDVLDARLTYYRTRCSRLAELAREAVEIAHAAIGQIDASDEGQQSNIYNAETRLAAIAAEIGESK